MDRASDLASVLWQGGCNLTEIPKTPANCDCCGLDRTIQYKLNDFMFLGSYCASKVELFGKDIEACRQLAKNPANLLNPFTNTVFMKE